jgi:hypothetical protein
LKSADSKELKMQHEEKGDKSPERLSVKVSPKQKSKKV